MDTTTRPTVTVEHHGPVCVLALDRPEGLNALRAEEFDRMRDVLREIAGSGGCRVLVLTGRGRAFSTGLDLNAGFGEAGPGRVQDAYAVMRLCTETILLLREIPQPVIAAVPGHAVRAGFALTAAADLRVAAPGATFDAAFTRVGMTPGDVGLSWFLPRLIGPSAAAEVFYTAGSLTAAEAHRLGLVNRIGDDALATAMTLAGEIVASSPMGVRQTKELLNASLGAGGFRQHLETELRSQVLCALTDDHEEAKAAFRQRRAPVFRDR